MQNGSAYRHYYFYINEYASKHASSRRYTYHFDNVNFLNKNMCIEDAKVTELLYSGNTVLPKRECVSQNATS